MRTRPCSRATRRRSSSTATSTATRRRARTRSSASSSSTRRAPTRRSRRCSSATSSSSTSPPTRTGASPTRAPTRAGYDLNRDLTIGSQPEARLIRDLIVEHRPIITLDLHGYVNPTLLHPSTPPHNVNNEYDLYIKHGLPNALNIEQGLKNLGYPEITRARIPFRDDAPGVWDDFPPIYVPSFAMLQSSIPYTIEAALQPGTGATAVRRADIDTDIHEVAIKTSLKYIQDHRNQVIFDQAEGYRRGWAGEPLRDIPIGYVDGWGEEDKYTTTFPRAYVIPAGTRQHSAPAVKRLVDLLVASGGRVTVAKAAFTAGGNTYPAGSYVLDLHQPKRGIVNSLLEPGIDLTDRVDDLYAGPGGWSQALTWGATVDTLWDTLPAVETERVYEGAAVGSLPAGDGDLLLDPQDAEDLLALNALLDQGVKTQRLADGSVLIPRSARALAQAQADLHGMTFKGGPSTWSGASLDKVVVAYNGGSEVRDTLDRARVRGPPGHRDDADHDPHARRRRAARRRAR